MRPEVRILGGFALMTVGVAGLAAMNLWTIPTFQQVPPEPDPVPTASVVTPPHADASEDVPATSGSGAADAGPVATTDAAADATTDSADAEAEHDGATSSSEDGTTFASIVFEPDSRALNKDLFKKLTSIAEYMRNNYSMMVTLTGHGDAGMEAAEYIRIGRFRAAAVMRTLVDFRVSGSRIVIALPKVEGNRVIASGISPGTVEVRIVSRWAKRKEGHGDGP